MVTGDSRRSSCKCIACNCTLVCGKSELSKHSNGKKHLQKVKLVRKNANVTDFFRPISTRDEDRQVQDFELRLSAFFAEHNVAFQIVDHLVPLLKEIIPDSKIIQKVTLGRQKCTNIVKNVLASSVTEDLINILKVNKFLILIDESTNIGLNKTMCVLVRYVNPQNGEVNTKLLDLVELMKCVCHTSAIIGSKACMTLPRAPEDLLRQTYTYLSGSSKRCSQLKEMQEFFQGGIKKILHVSATRWLSLQKCVVRMLENWDDLLGYFRVAVVEDKLKSAELILKELENVCTG